MRYEAIRQRPSDNIGFYAGPFVGHYRGFVSNIYPSEAGLLVADGHTVAQRNRKEETNANGLPV
jgi:hypothetical protein